MNAQQAHEAAIRANEKSVNEALRLIKEKIAKAANDGQFSITTSLPKMNETVTKEVTTILENEKYKVKRNKGSDQRDGSWWDNLIVSW